MTPSLAGTIVESTNTEMPADDWGPHDCPYEDDHTAWVIGRTPYIRGHEFTVMCPDCKAVTRDTRGEDTLVYVCACEHRPEQDDTRQTAQRLRLDVGAQIDEWEAYGNNNREATIHRTDEKVVIRCSFATQTHRWIVRSPTFFDDAAGNSPCE